MSKEAKEAAINEGDYGKQEKLSKDTSRLLSDICDKISLSEARVARNISLYFKIYEVFPSAYLFMHSLFLDINDNTIADPVQKEIVWKQLVKYLSAENHYAYPVKFMLRYYYLKYKQTVTESWQGLINNHPDSIAMFHILEAAVCVPWDLKEPVYYSLLDDKANHSAIFNSMYKSAFEKGGKINNKKAYCLLKRLSIDPGTFDYWKLSSKINAKHLRKDASSGKPDNASENCSGNL